MLVLSLLTPEPLKRRLRVLPIQKNDHSEVLRTAYTFHHPNITLLLLGTRLWLYPKGDNGAKESITDIDQFYSYSSYCTFLSRGGFPEKRDIKNSEEHFSLA